MRVLAVCRRRLLAWTTVMVSAVFVTNSAAQEKTTTPTKSKAKKTSEFLRIVRDDKDRPVSMDTAVARFVPKGAGKDSTTYVELVGAVHIGEKEYYAKLNDLFKSYDALLYELVAPEDSRVPIAKGERGVNPVSALQRGMKSMLELDFQLDEIDYQAANFVHADMSPDEFAQSMKDRGESMLQIIFRVMGQSMAMQANDSGNASDLQLLFALFAKDRATRLKRIMADQFEDLEGATAIFEGEDGSTIITERNKKALAVLARERNMGKKKIGIFYGAGHLNDMERRLIDEFGLEKVETRWLAAWNLADKK